MLQVQQWVSDKPSAKNFLVPKMTIELYNALSTLKHWSWTAWEDWRKIPDHSRSLHFVPIFLFPLSPHSRFPLSVSLAISRQGNVQFRVFYCRRLFGRESTLIDIAPGMERERANVPLVCSPPNLPLDCPFTVVLLSFYCPFVVFQLITGVKSTEKARKTPVPLSR